MTIILPIQKNFTDVTEISRHNDLIISFDTFYNYYHLWCGVNSFVVDPLFKKIMRNHTQMMLAFQIMVRFCMIKKKYLFHLLGTYFLYHSHIIL